LHKRLLSFANSEMDALKRYLARPANCKSIVAGGCD
jgi:hypothetical protein